MVNSFCKMPLSECNGTLVKVALGEEPADLVIRNVRLVSVTTHEIIEGADIAVSCGRIAYVGMGGHTAEHCIGPETTVLDGQGKYAAPGFLDGHIHIESSMVGVNEFARAVIPHGTVGVYADPHEIANVCGLEGVWAMFEGARENPLKAMITTPSCVPAVEGFEDTGSAIDASDVAKSMEREDVVGLGEMMNYPGILAGNANAIDEVSATLAAGYTVTGHFPDFDCDRNLNAYIASGVSSCHESTTPEQILARVRLGMYAQLREGSAWQDLRQLSSAITDNVVSSRYVNLVSDDLHPNTITDEGHLDRILRLAVSLGIDALEAIEMVTINTATCFQMQHELGSITPGKCADIVLLEDLVDFEVQRVFIDGRQVATYGVPTFECPRFEWPDWMTHTMRLGMDITPETFDIMAPEGCGDTVRVRAIRMSAGNTTTEAIEVDLPVVDGKVQADVSHDILKVFVFDRHHNKPSFGVGFVQGFQIRGTVAQTVGHDAHNLIVMGRFNDDMALAANELISCGGGEVAVHEGHVLAKVELPVGGIMSDADVDTVADKVERMQRAWRTMGCKMPSPFMTLALVCLACIPDRRLTNRGYVDCINYAFEDLFV